MWFWRFHVDLNAVYRDLRRYESMLSRRDDPLCGRRPKVKLVLSEIPFESHSATYPAFGGRCMLAAEEGAYATDEDRRPLLRRTGGDYCRRTRMSCANGWRGPGEGAGRRRELA